MSGVFPPGSRPDQWSTLGDHQRRIRALEAVPAADPVPTLGSVPPWTRYGPNDPGGTYGALAAADALGPGSSTSNYLTIAPNEPFQHLLSVTDAAAGDAQADFRQFNVNFGADGIVNEANGTITIGNDAVGYQHTYTYVVGNSATLYRNSDDYTFGDTGFLSLDNLVVAAGAELAFFGAAWVVTASDVSSSDSWAHKATITIPGDGDLNGLEWNLVKASGNGRVRNTLSVQSDSGAARALRLSAVSASSTAFALEILAGEVALALPASPGTSGTLYVDALGFVKVSP